jgi:hypothetical protein
LHLEHSRCVPLISTVWQLGMVGQARSLARVYLSWMQLLGTQKLSKRVYSTALHSEQKLGDEHEIHPLGQGWHSCVSSSL